jgi:hypothetical protein
MIRLVRGPPPKAFDAKLLRLAERAAAEFFLTAPQERAQRRFVFEKLPFERDILVALLEMSSAKCAYCERTGVYEVARHRPAQNATGLDGQVAHDHYWWLAFKWENLLPICPDCNRMKAARFPVEGHRAPVWAQGQDLADEHPLLIDPCVDQPGEHLSYLEDGRVVGRTRRGQVTVDLLALNRQPLLERRRLAMLETREEWNRPATEEDRLGALDNRREDFHALRRQLRTQWIAEEAQHSLFTKPRLSASFLQRVSARFGDLDRLAGQAADLATIARVAREKSERRIGDLIPGGLKDNGEEYFGKTRFVSRVEVESFRGIPKLGIDISGPKSGRAPWLVMLGENGCGKSSILQAIAIALMGGRRREAMGLDARRFLSYRAREGCVRVWLTDGGEPITVRMTRGDSKFQGDENGSRLVVLGYGSSRLLPRRGRHPEPLGESVRVQNLFNPFRPLQNPERWLGGLQQEQYDSAAATLLRVLPAGNEALLTRSGRKRPRTYWQTPASRLRLCELSDGYQSAVALASDMMVALLKVWPEIEVAEGVVLIDELGNHMHPRWKMGVVSSLRSAFPRLQFIVTTHDPLCLRNLEAEEVVVMRRIGERDGDQVVAVDGLPSPDALRVDQLLTSEMFGLNSTTSPEVDGWFREYYALLANDSPLPDERERIEQLRGLLEEKHQLGSSQRERMLLEAADRYIAQKRAGANRVALDGDGVAALLHIWNDSAAESDE